MRMQRASSNLTPLADLTLSTQRALGRPCVGLGAIWTHLAMVAVVCTRAKIVDVTDGARGPANKRGDAAIEPRAAMTITLQRGSWSGNGVLGTVKDILCRTPVISQATLTADIQRS